MTEYAVVLAKLEQQEKLIEDQNQKLSGIEKALTEIAIQGKEISHLSTQINALWVKYDRLSGPDGTVTKLKEYQAGCPRDAVKNSLQNQWVALGLIAALIGAIKIWG